MATILVIFILKMDFLTRRCLSRPAVSYSHPQCIVFSQNSLIQMEGYTLTMQDRSHTHNTRAKNGGGLAIYSSSDISIDTNSLQHLNTCNDHIESQWVILRPTNMKKIALGNIYRPPSGDQQIFITGTCTHHNPKKTRNMHFRRHEYRLRISKQSSHKGTETHHNPLQPGATH